MGREREEPAPERGERAFLLCASGSGAFLFRPVPGLGDSVTCSQRSRTGLVSDAPTGACVRGAAAPSKNRGSRRNAGCLHFYVVHPSRDARVTSSAETLDRWL